MHIKKIRTPIFYDFPCVKNQFLVTNSQMMGKQVVVAINEATLEYSKRETNHFSV